MEVFDEKVATVADALRHQHHWSGGIDDLEFISRHTRTRDRTSAKIYTRFRWEWRISYVTATIIELWSSIWTSRSPVNTSVEFRTFVNMTLKWYVRFGSKRSSTNRQRWSRGVRWREWRTTCSITEARMIEPVDLRIVECQNGYVPGWKVVQLIGAA